MYHVKHSVLLKIINILIISTCSLAQYSGGNGTEDDPYQISSAEDLILLGESTEDYDKHFVLTNDIDLSGHIFYRAVIAYDEKLGDSDISFQGHVFTGNFNGKGYKISNLSIYGYDFLGLFGHTHGATITKLGLEEVDIVGGREVGGLIGVSDGGLIIESYCTGSIMGTRFVGGLVGRNGSSIVSCHCQATVIGYHSGIGGDTHYVGGLIGINNVKIESSYSICDVSGGLATGGLVGLNNSLITGCYSNSSVSGSWKVGGLVGENKRGDISMCYSQGDIDGASGSDNGGLVGESRDSNISYCFSDASVSTIWFNAGGLIGLAIGGKINDCYATGEISAQSNSYSLIGHALNNPEVDSCYGTGSTSFGQGLMRCSHVTVSVLCFFDKNTTGSNASSCPKVLGLETVSMQTKQTYVDAGWDFETPIWVIQDGKDYPRLWWEITNEAPIADAGENQTVAVGDMVFLDGTASYDPEETELSYAWEFNSVPDGSDTILIDYDTAKPNFHADMNGTFVIDLVVNDGMFDSEVDSVSIEVLRPEDLAKIIITEVNEIIDTLPIENFDSTEHISSLLSWIATTLDHLDKVKNNSYNVSLLSLNKVLIRVDGCQLRGTPDLEGGEKDWIIDCDAQLLVYQQVTRAIELIERLTE